MEDLFKWVTSIGGTLGAVLGIWNFVQSPSRQNASGLEALGKNVDAELEKVDIAINALDGRISKIETIISQMPTKDSIHDLAMGIERITGRLETMNARLDPIDHLGRRLQEVLLEKTR